MRRSARAFLLAAAAVAAPAHALTLQQGDLVLVLEGTQTIVRVNLRSGATDVLSAPIPGFSISDIAFAPDGTLLIAGFNNSARNVYRVDPATGARTQLTPPGAGTVTLTTAPDGRIFVSVIVSGGGYRISQVDPSSGAITPVSNGGLINGDTVIGFEPSTNSIVAASGATVLRVNSVTGAQSLITASMPFAVANDIVVSPDGSILVSGDGPDILRIDPVTGAASVFIPGASDGFGACGALALEPAGGVIVSGASVTTNLVMRHLSGGGPHGLQVYSNMNFDYIQSMMAVYNKPACPADTNGDHAVDFLDLNQVLSAYGSACP